MSYGVEQVAMPQSFRRMAVLRFVWACGAEPLLWGVALPLLVVVVLFAPILFSWAPVSVVSRHRHLPNTLSHVWRRK